MNKEVTIRLLLDRIKFMLWTVLTVLFPSYHFIGIAYYLITQQPNIVIEGGTVEHYKIHICSQGIIQSLSRSHARHSRTNLVL